MRWLLPILLAGSASLAAGRAAWAEPVRLRSGTTLEATSVELQGDVFLLRLELGAGKGSMRLPLAQVAPADLVRLLAPRTKPDDAQGQLRIARAALEAGLFAEAVGRAATAAALDPAFAAEQARIEEGVRAALALEAVGEIELDLRLGRPAAARARALALLEHGVPVAPPALEAARARLLLGLAEGALASASKAAAKQAAAGKPAPVAPAAPAEPPPLAVLVDAAALTARALEARERAADPAVPPVQREALLSDAAVHLLQARRLLLALGPAATAGLLERLETLRWLLVATWLDLADLARGLGQLGVALDRVQAALVLEPESERAWELRRWLEMDFNPPIPLQTEPPIVFEGSFGSSFSGWGLGRVFPPAFGACVHGGCAHVQHHGHSHGGGPVRYAGTRR